MKYKVGDRVRIKDTDIEGTIESIIRGQFIVDTKVSKISVWPEDIVLLKSVGEETKSQFKVGDIVYNNAFDEYVRVTSIDGVHCYVQGLKDNATHYSHINNLIPCSEVKTINIAIEETINDISDKVTDTIMGQSMNGNSFNLPEGYIFKDENGNVINATKIVLEKKKKEYPKTYEECCKVLNIAVRDLDILDNMLDTTEIIYTKNLDRLLNSFRKLLICRDAYWKIAGEEMGLGKPWEPTMETVYCISRNYSSYRGGKSNILEFPTEEMRDAFYENFKELIEICKELL